MGGAQPLAVTGNGGAALCIEVDPWRAQRRLEHGYLDEIADSLDDGIARVEAAKRDRRALSVAVVANCADVLPELVRPRLGAGRGDRPDLGARRPATATCRTACRSRRRWSCGPAKPSEYVERSRESMAVHCRAMVDLHARRRGRLRLRQRAARPGAGHGLRRRVRLPGLRARLHPAAVRPRRRPVPLGLPVRLRSRPRRDRRGRARGLPGRRPAAALGAVRGARRSRARACRRGSAGSGTASGTWPARRSTTWSPPVRSRRRSSSAATTWTPARSPRRSGRPRG